MSFHNKSKDLLYLAIEKEYENACQEYGKSYHSLHEGWAILREEMEKVLIPIQDLKGAFENNLWRAVKANNPPMVTDVIEDIECSTILAMMELAQVYACCMKLQKTVEGEEK